MSDQGNSYKRKHLIGSLINSFRGVGHYHQGGAGVGEVVVSYILIYRQREREKGGKDRQRERQTLALVGAFETSKSTPQQTSSPSSNKAIPLILLIPSNSD